MRLARLVSIASFVLIPIVAACGGDEPVDPILLDAAVPDAYVVPDAEPCADDECDGVCTNFDNNEQTCGNCTTVCNGGEACTGAVCACVDPYVPAQPSFIGSQLTTMIPGAISGFGVYGTGFTPTLLGVGYPSAGVEIGEEYTLTAPPPGGIPTPPFMAAGYNVDLQEFTADTAHFATGGILVFDTVCAEGFSGHGTDIVFSAVAGLTDPTIDLDGCAPFTVPTLTFAFGTACPVTQE